MKLKKHKLPQDKYLAKPSIIEKKLLKKLLKLNRKARLLYLGYFYSYNFFLYKNIIIISLCNADRDKNSNWILKTLSIENCYTITLLKEYPKTFDDIEFKTIVENDSYNYPVKHFLEWIDRPSDLTVNIDLPFYKIITFLQKIKTNCDDVAQKELEDIITKLKASNRRKIQDAEDSVELLLKSEGYAISQSQSYKVDFKLVSDIRLGIKECRKLTATYNDKERSLIPLGLIYGEKVFLVAKEDGKGDKIYQYALHKFKDLKVSYNKFEAQDFNLKEYSQKSFGVYQGEVYDVKLKFIPEAAEDVLNYNFHPTQKMRVQDDGTGNNGNGKTTIINGLNAVLGNNIDSIESLISNGKNTTNLKLTFDDNTSVILKLLKEKNNNIRKIYFVNHIYTNQEHVKQFVADLNLMIFDNFGVTLSSNDLTKAIEDLKAQNRQIVLATIRNEILTIADKIIKVEELKN